METKPPKTPTQSRVHIGASEVMYLAGLAFLFCGAWQYIGIGPALMLIGGMLILTALINNLEDSAARARESDKRHAL